MLNDLMLIERGLQRSGIVTAGRHPSVKDMAKGGILRVRLANDGSIADLDWNRGTGRGSSWTLRDGQHNGFPGFKLDKGLLDLAADDRELLKLPGKTGHSPTIRSDILRLATDARLDPRWADWPKASFLAKVEERRGLLASLSSDPNTAAVPAAFERFLLAAKPARSFPAELVARLVERFREGSDEWIEPARAMFADGISIQIDVAEDDFPRDAGDEQQIAAVSRALMSADGGDADGVCALTGRPAALHRGNFPQPNLPGLGQTYLFARNRDIPALTRYGRTADGSFSIDSDLLGRLSGAVTALTDDRSKGLTWKLVPAETGDKPDLLIASFAAAPSLRLADGLADDVPFDVGEIDGRSRLDELASRVLTHVKGEHTHERSEDEILMLVLRTVDPANRKTVYQRQATAQTFHAAAVRWGKVASNLPAWLGFPIPSKDGVRFLRPPSVAPLSLTLLSRSLFANGGRRRVGVIGVPMTESFALFLGEGNLPRRAGTVLRTLLKRHGALLAGLADARNKGIEELKDFDPKVDLRRDALRSATWLGILLNFVGRPKEIYMKDAAFQLGQLLAEADTVHIGYCMDVRRGAVPPSLLGNALLSMAGTNPARALSLFSARWPPYAAWAKRMGAEQGGKPPASIAVRKAVSRARRMGDIARNLQGMLEGCRLDESFKAELLLGYVAGLPPLPRKETASTAEGISSDQEYETEGDVS